MCSARVERDEPRFLQRLVAALSNFGTYWLPVLAWMALIFWFSFQSSLPRSADPLLEVITKKGAHAGEYAILALLFLRALSQGGAFSSRLAVIAWLLAVLYAASDEFHQSFTPSRTPSPFDVLIDASGGAFALALVRHLMRPRR